MTRVRVAAFTISLDGYGAGPQYAVPGTYVVCCVVPTKRTTTAPSKPLVATMAFARSGLRASASDKSV